MRGVGRGLEWAEGRHFAAHTKNDARKYATIIDKCALYLCASVCVCLLLDCVFGLHKKAVGRQGEGCGLAPDRLDLI